MGRLIFKEIMIWYSNKSWSNIHHMIYKRHEIIFKDISWTKIKFWPQGRAAGQWHWSHQRAPRLLWSNISLQRNHDLIFKEIVIWYSKKSWPDIQRKYDLIFKEITRTKVLTMGQGSWPKASSLWSGCWQWLQ